MSSGPEGVEFCTHNVHITLQFPGPFFMVKKNIDNTYAKAYITSMTTISATQARANLYEILDKVAKSGQRVGITKKGETKAYLISSDEYDSWQETNEIMADKGLMRAIKQGEKDIKEGRVYDWEDVKKELGWDKF